MKFEFSAGGIVFKKENQSLFILIAQHSQHHGWVFPKGLIGDHVKEESKESTALREVKEETGVDAEIVKELEPVTFWYVFNGEKIKKTVYYYIMKHVGGNFENRDMEMESVEWVPLDEVVERLTYKSDKQVFEEARPIIEQLTQNVKIKSQN
jgi:8-oxo-dGTP diphosphatase